MGRLWDMVTAAFLQWRTFGRKEAVAVRAARRAVEAQTEETVRRAAEYEAAVLGDVGAAVSAASAARGGRVGGGAAVATRFHDAMERLRARVDDGGSGGVLARRLREASSASSPSPPTGDEAEAALDARSGDLFAKARDEARARARASGLSVERFDEAVREHLAARGGRGPRPTAD